MARHGRRPRRSVAPAPLRRGRTEILEIGAQGDGIGELEGATIYVPLTAPGDIALVEARGERGALVELLEQSPHRALAPCLHYGECGGCALQHVSTAFYRHWKRQRVIDALARAGLDARVAEIVTTPYASRRRATFAVQKARGDVIIGFNARQSSRVVGVTACHVLHPALMALLGPLRGLAQEIAAEKFDLSVTLCDNGIDADVISPGAEGAMATQGLTRAMRMARCLRLSFNGEPLLTLSPPVVLFDDVAVTPPPGGFLQASKEGEAALQSLVAEATKGARKIADLFSGCGSFALPLARSATVYAADTDAAPIAALTAAAANAQRSGAAINPVRTEARNLFERPLTAKELNDFDAVVFDPPRAGAAAQAAELAKSRVKTVASVSCNPSTFARDAAILSQGGYKLAKVTPVDQFVYSPHIELVAEFRR